MCGSSQSKYGFIFCWALRCNVTMDARRYRRRGLPALIGLNVNESCRKWQRRDQAQIKNNVSHWPRSCVWMRRINQRAIVCIYIYIYIDVLYIHIYIYIDVLYIHIYIYFFFSRLPSMHLSIPVGRVGRLSRLLYATFRAREHGRRELVDKIAPRRDWRILWIINFTICDVLTRRELL